MPESSEEPNEPNEPEECAYEECAYCEREVDSCECLFCESCGRRITDSRPSCSNCAYCESCCECVFCQRCDGECRDDYCNDCDTCNGCCRCEDRETVEFFSPCAPKFHTAARTERKRNLSARYISAEIEIASVERDADISSVVRDWGGAIVKDGSLPTGGFEINTAPASGDKFMMQIDEICTTLSNSGAKVTHACGLHVHIDARDYDYYLIRRLARVYAEIEPALFGMLPSRRRTSTYCRPCGSQYRDMAAGLQRYKSLKNDIIEKVYNRPVSRDTGNVKRTKYMDARYNALNLHSWFYRGTVECRMFVGTANAHKIQSWGRIWATILDYVAKLSDEETDKFVSATPTAIAALCPAQKLLAVVAGQPDLEAFIRERIQKYAPTMLNF